MEKTKFDIKYIDDIKNGKLKVVTSINKPVSIIKWDLKGRYPILGVTQVKCSNYTGEETWFEERPLAYNDKGECVSRVATEYDLYILIPEEETEAYKEKIIIKDIIEYLECYPDFDSGDEPYEEYRERFEKYISFMKGLHNRLYPKK